MWHWLITLPWQAQALILLGMVAMIIAVLTIGKK